jgi:hypothetical protein
VGCCRFHDATSIAETNNEDHRNAKLAVELGNKRERLIERANAIRMANKVLFATARQRQYSNLDYDTLEVEFEGFRELVTKEIKAQIAPIDEQLRNIGVELNPFDALPVKGDDAEDDRCGSGQGGSAPPCRVYDDLRRRRSRSVD